jgi:membrane fusion protein, multidrug efflux system
VRATRIVNWFKHHVVIGTLLGLVILFTVYELVSGVLVYSRDAYITTDVIGVAPQVSGPLSTLAVKDNQLVQQGDLLIKIDPEPFQLDLDRLQANLELARATEERAKEEVSTASDRIASQQAQLDDAKAAFERATELRKSGNIDQQDLDNARRTFDVATAQLRAAQASRVTAEREIVQRRFAWPRLAALRQC